LLNNAYRSVEFIVDDDEFREDSAKIGTKVKKGETDDKKIIAIVI